MRKYNWKLKEFNNIFEMLDFVNSYKLTSEDFKVFSHQGFAILIYNEAVIEELECS